MNDFLAEKSGKAVLEDPAMAGTAPDLDLSQLLTKQVSVDGYLLGSRAHQESMIETLEACRITPTIDSTFDLPNIAAALQYQQSGRAFGKVVIEH